jgi:membrane glycosyltransferase
MELPLTPGLNPEQAESQACAQYLDRLPLGASALLVRADSSDGCGSAAAMSHLHQALARDRIQPDNPAYASIDRRLELAFGAPQTADGAVIARDVHDAVRVVSTPVLNRTSMAPKRWPATVLSYLVRSFKDHIYPRRERSERRLTVRDRGPESPDPRGRWHSVGTFRRIALGVVVVAQTYVATDFMTAVLPYHGTKLLEIAILVLFAILFCWVSAGFWTAIMGFFLLLSGRDRYAISATAAPNAPIDARARTAIVMPICNEDVARVFAGLRATYESLSRTGELSHFDFYVLSDSNRPDARIAEQQAWLDLCRTLGAFGRVFYRWRQHRIKRKSGNVADFCRRWGRNYRYMLILDADSVMSGECLTTLVRLMEANPNAGIIQTAPRAAGSETLYTRIQQFANRVYGPVFIAGMHFFQLGEAHYWGHNAIIRVAPFMEHCALARLPGRGTLSGDILSHDFVEAALMRRAGWAVWIAYDLPGSYEEMPPNLVDELKRDRRWCQGNLINSRLCLAQGLHPAHRAVFVSGVMAYVSALLWFAFLLLSTVLLAVHTLVEPEYFVRPSQLFPLWPEWHPGRGIGLYAVTATLLFLPKILSVALAWTQGARDFGGGLRLAASMLTEMVFSALLAPIRMLFHSQFVAAALSGWAVQWKSPPREDAQTTWSDALRHHGWHSLLGVVWAGVVYWLNPAFLWWLLPVVGALIISIPISVYSSRVSLGRRSRQVSLFLIPEEAHPPKELRWTRSFVKSTPPLPGFVEAVVDPVTNALACSSASARSRRPAGTNVEREQLLADALIGGPGELTVPQKVALLRDPAILSKLHFEVWTSALVHAAWVRARVAKGAIARTPALDTELIASRPLVRTGTGWMLPAHAKGAEGFGKFLRAMRRRGPGAP